ncbi:MAG: hypothetical protein AB1801_18815 [Chloroflexota bacterium]
MVRLASINCHLYNGYALKLAEAIGVAVEARQNRLDSPLSPPKSIGTAIELVAQRQPADRPASPPEELSFESLFRRATQPAVAEEVPA